MKRLLFFLLVLIGLQASAQIYQNRPEYGWLFKRIKIDSALTLPRDTALRSNVLDPGAIVYQISDKSLYTWDGSKWNKIVSANTLSALDSIYSSNDSIIAHKTVGGVMGVKLNNIPQSGIIGLTDTTQAQTLQRVTERGNTTSVNIRANGGIDASSGNLLIGTGATTSRVRMSRFLDLYGQSTGPTNGAFISYYKSDGTRVAAQGDGSSWDDNMYTVVNSNNAYRMVMSSGQLNTDPLRNGITITPYSDSAKVLIGDTISGGRIYPYIRHSVRGNQLVYNTQNNAAFTEYSDGDSIYVSVGKLGQPEANLGFNFDYSTRVHRLYKTSSAASWLALAAGGAAIQYCPATTVSGDVWSAAGSPYAMYWSFASPGNAKAAINTNAASPTGDGNLLVVRSGGQPSITGDVDLVIDAARTKGTSGAVYTNSYNTGPTLISFGGGSASVGGGSPTSKLMITGSIAYSVRTITASRTLDITDCIINGNISSNIVVTLPTAVGITGRLYIVKKTTNNANTITFNTTSGQTIDGAASGTLVISAFNDSKSFYSDGANWFIF